MSVFLGATSAGGRSEPESPVKRPAAITTDAVPEIPAELSQGVLRYQDIRSASFLDWHPAGGILIKSRLGDLEQLYHVAVPLNPPLLLTHGGEPAETGRYLPDGSLVFSRGTGGDENFQIYLVRGGWGDARLLTDGKSRNVLQNTDGDGRRLAFSSTRRNGRDADLFLLEDPSSRSPARLLFQVDNATWSVEDWSADGREALLSRYVSVNEAYGYLLDLAGGSKTPLRSEGGPANGTVPVGREAFRFGPGSRSIYFASDAASEYRALVRLDRESGATRWLTADVPGDVEQVEISPDRRLAALLINAGGLSRLFLLDLEKADRGEEIPAIRREVELPPSVATGVRFSPDSKRIGFTLSRASAPAEAYTCDLASGSLTRWTQSRNPGFAPGDFVEPELIRYPSFDGREIPAQFYPPPRRAGSPGARSPVIVVIHGGPESQSRPAFSARVQYYLRELGAAVIAPNVRGSTGYGKSYALLDNGLKREDSVRDIGALLDWIQRQPRLDAGRVAVLGGSYGGYMVLASLVRYPERIRAGVESVGISNFITFLENTSPYRQQVRRAEYGDERDPEMRRFFEKVSPAHRMAAIRSALLMIHGANDPRVPMRETESIVERARSSGQPVWTLYASNEGHGFTRLENIAYEAAVVAVFLRRFL